MTKEEIIALVSKAVLSTDTDSEPTNGWENKTKEELIIICKCLIGFSNEIEAECDELRSRLGMGNRCGVVFGIIKE